MISKGGVEKMHVRASDSRRQSTELECGEVTTVFWEEGQCNSNEKLGGFARLPVREGFKYQKVGFSPDA